MNMTEKTSKLTIMAMLCALAFVAVAAIRIPLVPAVPFLQYEPKDVILVIGGFIFGPLAAALMIVIVSFIEMFTISGTGIIGFIMNVLSSVAFVCPAAWFYRKKHSMGGAVAGMVVGTILLTIVMLLWNYLITPYYMGYPREAVAALLLPAFTPFNLLKGALNTALTLLLYKPIVTTLRRSHLLVTPTVPSGSTSRINISATLVALFILVTCVLIVLVLKGNF